MYSPIVMFVYNRADHFEKTYCALLKCAEAKESDLFIFSDGAKNEKAVQGVSDVRKKLEEIRNDPFFKSINIIESGNNKGLAASVISGVTKVINEYGRVIVVEDDCEVSPYFLKYMNSALDKFEDDERIGSIAGFTPDISFPADYKSDVFTSYRSCSWGWATWKNRFENVDWELKDIKSFYRNKNMIKKFNSSGSDRFIRLYRQTKGNGSSWSVRFGLHLVKNDMLTVYPRYSYVKNIGCDESGVHSRAEDAEKVNVDIEKAIPAPVINFAFQDKRIEKAMKKQYSAGMISDIKRLLAMKYVLLKEK